MLLVSREDGICTLTINRPEKLNTLTVELFSRLSEALRAVSGDGQTRVVVLRGAGEKAFSAGYDVSQVGRPDDYQDKEPMEDVTLAFEACPVPVIAMIYGYCVAGGCSLAVACDLRLAADNARLGITAARLGVIYPPSALNHLIHLVGVATAKELLYTGRLIDAESAREVRLVNQVVPADQLAAVTYNLAREIAENAPLSVRGTKKIISRLLSYHDPGPQDRKEFLSLQRQANQSDDLREGQRAFARKGKPVFKGK